MSALRLAPIQERGGTTRHNNPKLIPRSVGTIVSLSWFLIARVIFFKSSDNRAVPEEPLADHRFQLQRLHKVLFIDGDLLFPDLRGVRDELWPILIDRFRMVALGRARSEPPDAAEVVILARVNDADAVPRGRIITVGLWPCPQEWFLNDIFSVRPPASDPPSDARQLGAVAGDQGVEPHGLLPTRAFQGLLIREIADWLDQLAHRGVSQLICRLLLATR